MYFSFSVYKFPCFRKAHPIRDTFSPYRITIFQIENLMAGDVTMDSLPPLASNYVSRRENEKKKLGVLSLLATIKFSLTFNSFIFMFLTTAHMQIKTTTWQTISSMPRLCPTGHILRPQRPPARPFQVGRYECVFPSLSF